MIWQDGKAKPMRLPRVVVGILPQQQHLHFAKRSEVKCIEYIVCRRIYHKTGILLLHEQKQLFVIWLLKLL